MTRWNRAVLAFALAMVMGILLVAAPPYTQRDAAAEETQTDPSAEIPTQKPDPTSTPTPDPTPELTPEPTPEPTPESTFAPTAEATDAPTGSPTEEATPDATQAETAVPTVEPSLEPSPTPQSNELILKHKSRSRSDLKLDDLVYLEGGMKIPALFQYDYDTVIATLGERDIRVSSTGCGTTALSMAIAYLKEDYNQTPYTLLYEAIKGDMYRGDGLGHGALSKLARRHGLRAQWIWASKEKILEALQAGYPVIAHMGKGTFTEDGHYILLRGVAEDGRIYVTDPNSRSNSNKTYSLSQIIQESKTDDPFLILSLPEEEPTPLPDPKPTPTAPILYQ